MKLQKLVYFAHGWWLAYKDNPLLSEKPQVWRYGPVFPSLYQDLKVYGNQPIKEPVKLSPFDTAAPTVPANDDETNALIDWIWKRYGHLSGSALSELSHKKGTAWFNIAEEHQYSVPQGLELADEEVRREFNALKTGFNAA